jgi:hypothetical protein
MRPFAIAMALLVHVLDKQAQGPYLSMMRVSTELKVNAQGIGMCQTVWLMVEKYDREGVVCLRQKFFQRLALTIASVIATNYLHTIGQCCHTVAEKVYGGIAKKAPALPYSADILMVAWHHVDAHRGAKSGKSLLEWSLIKRNGAIVYEVAHDKDDVGMLLVDLPYIGTKLGNSSAIAKVHIADGHNAKWLVQGGLLVERYAYLLYVRSTIIDVAIEE